MILRRLPAIRSMASSSVRTSGSGVSETRAVRSPSAQRSATATVSSTAWRRGRVTDCTTQREAKDRPTTASSTSTPIETMVWRCACRASANDAIISSRLRFL